VAGHADRGHAPSLGRQDPARSVLDHEAGVRGDAELLGSGQEDHRVGLAARQVPPGDICVEQLVQRHPLVDDVVVETLLGGEGVQPDPFEEELGVLRRGRRATRIPVLDGQDAPQSVGKA
jgi:hypothetical protein